MKVRYEATYADVWYDNENKAIQWGMKSTTAKDREYLFKGAVKKIIDKMTEPELRELGFSVNDKPTEVSEDPNIGKCYYREHIVSVTLERPNAVKVIEA